MREIIFDTETTGLDNKADRVIEIGGIELMNHFPTGRTFHVYINPGDRKVHPDALAVHGITDDFLKDKPPFAGIVAELQEFFDGAKWIAHNATVVGSVQAGREVADQVVFMDEGRVVEAGPPTAIFDTPQSPRLQSFLAEVL